MSEPLVTNFCAGCQERQEEIEAIHAQVKKIVDEREAALDEIERLRTAIKSEAEQHALNPETGLPALYPCDCRICLIAREGR